MILKFKEFTEKVLRPIYEKSNKEVTQTLVSKYPDKLGLHSEDNRVKNLSKISIEEFSSMIKDTFNVETIINPPGRSGSSKFSSVQFEIEGKTKNILLAGGAVATKGHGFEDNVFSDLVALQSNRVFDEYSYNYPGIIKAIIEEFGIDESTSFTVTKEASANKKRELSISPKGIVIGTGNLDIGSTITDITLDINGSKKYISLKLGNTVQFSNTGLTDIFPKNEVLSGNITNPLGVKLLEMFGIDNSTFCDVFNSYGKKKFKEFHELEKSVDPESLEDFVRSAMGYGYYMLHIAGNEKTFQFYEVTEAEMKKDTKVVSKMDVLYGGVTGGAKNVYITFKTSNFVFEVDFRNRSGAIEPTVMGTKYNYQNWRGLSVDK
jgi:hypothetical protein